ncbi:MAG: enoyl-CoA hydratase/isomerase family protein [Betaproteobacteria bacterium]|nr:enoyl-CoA hydratase/isomerase family protein [Betaproteobacteria bacterium]
MSGERKRIILEKNTGTKVAHIILNRPEKRNALDLETIDEILDALEELRNDPAIRVVVTKANGPSFCSGIDLYYLRSYSQEPPRDWERSSRPRALFDAIRDFPKVTIAQVHGYCVGGGLVLMMSHDLAFAGSNAQFGMPEIIRGSFGQNATSNLYHSGIPIKKAAMIQFTGYNVSGADADRMGMVSHSVDESELEKFTLKVAGDIATYHPGAVASAKIAVQMGSKLPLPDAMKLDQLVGAWQQQLIDPLAHVEDYLSSQAGGPKPGYKRPDA